MVATAAASVTFALGHFVVGSSLRQCSGLFAFLGYGKPVLVDIHFRCKRQ